MTYVTVTSMSHGCMTYVTALMSHMAMCAIKAVTYVIQLRDLEVTIDLEATATHILQLGDLEVTIDLEATVTHVLQLGDLEVTIDLEATATYMQITKQNIGQTPCLRAPNFQ